MTAEELIIGHYEKTLTPEQESHLAEMVAGSPDVRGLFEQHGNIHGLMLEDASAVKTSSKLDRVVLGAALGTLAEIAGHGIGFSLLGKVATVIGVVAAGGIGVMLFTGDDDTDATRVAPKSAVERSATPAASADPVDAANTNASAPETPIVDAPATTSTDAETRASVDARSGSPTRAQQSGQVAARGDSGKPKTRPQLGPLNTRNPAVTIKDSTKIKPNK